MRTLRIALSLALVFVSTATLAKNKTPQRSKATQGCNELHTKEADRVSDKTVGYTVTDINFVIPVPKGKKPEDIAKPMNMMFGIYAISPNFRHSVDNAIRALGVCLKEKLDPKTGRYSPPNTTWIASLATVEEGSITETTYTLHTAILLPNDIVESRPPVRTTMRNGPTLIGEWSMNGMRADVTLKVR